MNQFKENDLQRAIDEITRKNNANEPMDMGVGMIPPAPTPAIGTEMMPGGEAMTGAMMEPVQPMAAPEMPQAEVVENTTVAETTPVGDLQQVKMEALKDLAPILSQLDMPAEKKLDLCYDILEATGDKSVLSAAHMATKEIRDEAERAKALLKLIEAIDAV